MRNFIHFKLCIMVSRSIKIASERIIQQIMLLTEDIRNALDNSNIACGIFID